VEQVRRLFEDTFLEASADDDYVGVQTYTRIPVPLPAAIGPVVRAAMALAPVRDRLLPPLIRRATAGFGDATHPPEDGIRRTQMGYEFWPQALEATLRYAWRLTGGVPLLVTENGIATDVDDERIEYVEQALSGVLACLADGIDVRGYVYWSLLDNFEWILGYRPTFGLVAVDRATQVRTVKPSARWLGEIARANAMRER
jgi:beta-glucosidase